MDVCPGGPCGLAQCSRKWGAPSPRLVRALSPPKGIGYPPAASAANPQNTGGAAWGLIEC